MGSSISSSVRQEIALGQISRVGSNLFVLKRDMMYSGKWWRRECGYWTHFELNDELNDEVTGELKGRKVGGQAEANETCLWHFACGNDVTTRGLNDDSGGWGGSSARQRHPVGISSAEWQSARGCVGSQRDRGLAALQRGASTRGTTAQTLIQQPKGMCLHP